MRRVTILSLAILLVFGAASAEEQQTQRSVFDDYLNPAHPGGGFLRIPGLDFRSSVGFSYSSSDSYGSGGMGYYMGHFSCRLGSSLTLNWDVGVGSTFQGAEGMNDYTFFIPNVDLTYRPSDRFVVRLQYQQYRFGSPFFLDPYRR